MIRVAVGVEGWNAEAAIGFALAARKFTSAVRLSTHSETADGKDDIEVMTLAPEPGEEVVMEVEGRDEKEAFKTLLARLLGVIEPPKDRLSVVLGLGQGLRTAQAGRRAASPYRRRTAEVAALDVEEVAPARPRRRIPDVVALGAGSPKPPRRKKQAKRKPTKKARRGQHRRKK